MSRKKRSYHSETRHSQAEKTKLNVLNAAQKLFQTEGFDRVTINMLATAANVSMPTIYALFKSKAGVLQSLIDSALPEEQREDLVEKSMKNPSPKQRLSMTAKLTRRLYDAEKELLYLLRNASGVAPEFKELEQEREKRRYERQGDAVKKLAKERSLAKGLTLQQARDILWALTGRDMYRMFVIERKWSSEKYEKWLAQLLIKTLL